MFLLFAFVAVMRQRSNSDIVKNAVTAFARRPFDITVCFANVNGICDAHHIALMYSDLTTPHETRGYHEHC